MSELSSVNECRKTRPASDPYEVWDVGFCYYLVIAKQKSPKGEAADPYARWTVTTVGEYAETGDMYAAEVKRMGRRVSLTAWHNGLVNKKKYG